MAGIGFLIGEHWPENSHFALARTGANLQALLSPVPLVAKQRWGCTGGTVVPRRHENLSFSNEKLIVLTQTDEVKKGRDGEEGGRGKKKERPVLVT